MSLLGVVSRVVRHGSAAVCKVLSKPQAVSFTSLTANSSKTPTVSTKITSCSLLEVSKRFNSYDPYTDVEAPSPYKNKPMHRIGYKYKYYTGGMLPRPDGDEWEKPLPYPKPKGDKWTKKKALFGQNDYIDILGDEKIEPWRLTEGPMWIKGFRGNELQRLIRRLKFEGRYLQDMKPDQYHKMRKQIWYLYKKYNQRRVRSNFWGRGAGQKCRIFKY